MSFLEKIQQNILYIQTLIKRSVNFVKNKGVELRGAIKARIQFTINKINSFVKYSKDSIVKSFKASLKFIENIPLYLEKLAKKFINALVYSGELIKRYSLKCYHYILSVPARILRYLTAVKNLFIFGFNQGYEFVKNLIKDLKQFWKDFRKAAIFFAKELFNFIKNIPSYLLRFIKDTINEVKQLCQDFAKFVRNFVSAMLVFIKNIPSCLLRFIKDTINEIKQLCQDFAKFVRNFASATFDFIKNIPNYLSTLFKETWNAIKNACQAFKKASIYLANALKDFAISTIEVFVEYISQTVDQIILHVSFAIGAVYAVYSLSVETLADMTQWTLLNGLGISVSQTPLVEVITAGLSMGLLGVFTGAMAYLSCKAAAFIYRKATLPSEEQVKQSTEVDKSFQAVYPSLFLGSATHSYLNQFSNRSPDKMLGESLANVAPQETTKNNTLRLAV